MPDSIFDISRTSLISSRRWAPERLILERQSFTFSVFCRLLSAITVIPRMAFMGVRISWLIRDRNSDFA